MEQAIVEFFQDDENHWVAKLACGHTQHTRHDPPWQSRLWVVTSEGRATRVGTTLNCKKCDEEAGYRQDLRSTGSLSSRK